MVSHKTPRGQWLKWHGVARGSGRGAVRVEREVNREGVCHTPSEQRVWGSTMSSPGETLGENEFGRHFCGHGFCGRHCLPCGHH